MSWDNRVIWSEGTFLQPQHLQVPAGVERDAVVGQPELAPLQLG